MNVLNAIVQKVATILFLLAVLVPFFKKGLENSKFKEGKFIYKAANFVDKRHELIGKLALLLALVHGLLGDVKLFSFNWGTVCFVAILVSLVPCAFHKKDKKDMGRLIHILLSVPALITFVLHIVLESV